MAGEVSVAYGTRGTAKLLELLGSDVLAPADTAAAAKLLTEQLVSPEKVVEATEGGAMQMALYLLQSRRGSATESVSVRATAGRMLAALLPQRSARQALLATPGAVELLAASAGSDPELRVRNALADALAQFTAREDGAVAIVQRAPAVAHLVAALAPTPAIVHAVAHVAGADAASASALLAAGAMRPLMDLLRQHGGDAGLALSGLITLRGLVGSEAGKVAALANGVVPVTLRHVAAGESSTAARRAAVGVLALQALHLPSKREYLAAGDGLAAPLLALLRDSDSVVAATAAVAVRHLSEAPEGMRAFTRVLVPDTALFLRVYGAAPACVGACSALVALLDVPSGAGGAERDAAAALAAAALDAINALMRSAVHGDARAAIADAPLVADRLARLAYATMSTHGHGHGTGAGGAAASGAALAGKARVAIDLLVAEFPDFATTLDERRALLS
jgi:hypothetical protein